MEEREYSELDSDKGQWLLDIAAFREWQIDQHNSGSITVVKPDKGHYQELRETALELYKQLYGSAQSIPDNTRIRLFRYVAGETLEEIAESESVTRQAIHKSLKQMLNGMTIKQARQIWFYGQHYSS